MILKGNVTGVDNINRKARVTFKDRDNSVTSEITIAHHVGNLEVNDTVAVAFFTNSLADGLIIAKF